MSCPDEHIKQKMCQRQIPGLAVRLYHAGGRAFEKEWGYADINTKSIISNETIFRVGCLTKPVIAVTILTLAEEGFFDLDDNIIDYLPSLAGSNLPYFSEITIAHLLAHRSGIARGTYYEDAPDIDKLLTEIAKTEIAFKPGTAYKYSNWGYLLLGEICSAVTGTAVTDYCTKRILAPLQMNDTFFQTKDISLNNMAKGYWDNWHFGFPDLSQPLVESKWFPIAPSASGLVCTPDDFGKFIRAITQIDSGDGGKVLPANIFKHIFTRIADKGAHKFTSLCLYSEEIDHRDVWYFPGTNSGFSAYFFYIPSLGISGVAMANRTACNNELRELLELIISSVWPDIPASCLTRRPIPFEGEFADSSGEILHLKIGPENGNQVVLNKKITPLLFCSPRNYFQLDGNYRQHMLRIHTKMGEIYEVTNGARSYRPASSKKAEKNGTTNWLSAFTGIFEYPAFGRAEVLHRGHKLYLNFGVIYETVLTNIEQNTFRQTKGPFAGECIQFAPPAGSGANSPYFILNGMKFKRFD